MIEIEQLTKSYRGATHAALDAISISVPEGCLFGLLGPNGAGKTTLLSILLGLISKDAGRVTIAGRHLVRERRMIQPMIGFVPQDLAFYPSLSVRQNLDFYAGACGLEAHVRRERIEACVSMTGLNERLDSKAQNLSGGLKRRLNLAIGLLKAPRILCLDEPVVGIDPQSRRLILHSIRLLRDDGVTIIYTSHDLDEVQRLCDRAAIIDRGQIMIEGSVTEMLARAGGQRLYLQFASPPGEVLLRRMGERFNAEVNGGARIAIATDDPTRTLAALHAALTPSDPAIAGIHYGPGSLEDLFLGITSRGTGS